MKQHNFFDLEITKQSYKKNNKNHQNLQDYLIKNIFKLLYYFTYPIINNFFLPSLSIKKSEANVGTNVKKIETTIVSPLDII